MGKKIIQLKCRNCNDIIEPSFSKYNKCSCGKCSLRVKGDEVTISSVLGIGSYIIIQDGKEYVFVSKEELEESNG